MDCNPIALVDPLGASTNEGGDAPTTMSPGGDENGSDVGFKSGVGTLDNPIILGSVDVMPPTGRDKLVIVSGSNIKEDFPVLYYSNNESEIDRNYKLHGAEDL